MRYTSYYRTNLDDRDNRFMNDPFGNYQQYRKGDLIIAQSKDPKATIRILKGIITEPENYEKGETYITVVRCGYTQTYTVPTKLIVMHVPSIYPRFDELKTEILSMSSEDGEDYKRLYNVYKMYDTAKYHIGDYVTAYYKTETDYVGKFRPCIVTAIDISDNGTICYDVTTVEDKTMQISESDIFLDSSQEEYQQERREYKRSRQEASEVRIANHDASISNIETTIHDLESVVAKLQGDLQVTNNSINTANTGGVIRISDDVQFNRLDVLEEKQRKTQKLVKLGLSLLLGGM